MLTADYDFYLPSDLIAQKPAKSRDQSRLLLLNRNPASISHHEFPEITGFLRSGDVLVLNDTRVISARLRAINAKTGGKFELLLLEEVATNEWWAMVRPGKRASIGTELILLAPDGSKSSLGATVLNKKRGKAIACFDSVVVRISLIAWINMAKCHCRRTSSAQIYPKPNWITNDTKLYLLKRLVQLLHLPPVCTSPKIFCRRLNPEAWKFVLLLCTWDWAPSRPVKAETIAEHKMHEERFEISGRTAEIINEAKKQRRRIVAVGTTSLRVLESAAKNSLSGSNAVSPGASRTKIFIYPPYDFKIVDALLTNFHLPRSTLLMLISAFAAPKQMEAGRKIVLEAYQEAITKR